MRQLARPHNPSGLITAPVHPPTSLLFLPASTLTLPPFPLPPAHTACNCPASPCWNTHHAPREGGHHSWQLSHWLTWHPCWLRRQGKHFVAMGEGVAPLREGWGSGGVWRSWYGAVLSNSWHKWRSVFGRGDNTNQLLVVFTIIVAPPLSVASLNCVCLCARVCRANGFRPVSPSFSVLLLPLCLSSCLFPTLLESSRA